MEILTPESILLGKIIGVTMVVAGLSLIIKRAQWLAITKDLIEKPTILYTAALFEFVIGLIIVLIHPIWIPCWPVIITILGWMMMIGSAFYLLLPHKVIKDSLKTFAKPSYIVFKGVILVLLGAYISVMAFGEITFLDRKIDMDKDEAMETLTQNSWTWIETVYADDETFIPNYPEEFVLTFNEDGSMGSLTDCNTMGGNFEIDKKGSIEFSQIFSTMMYCEGSQENEYQGMLSSSEGFYFENENLVLTLQDNEGKMLFTKTD